MAWSDAARQAATKAKQQHGRETARGAFAAGVRTGKSMMGNDIFRSEKFIDALNPQGNNDA